METSTWNVGELEFDVSGTSRAKKGVVNSPYVVFY